jgi:AcrR family transcriptional regulator
MSDRVSAAVGRALDERQRGATEEVERILAATVRLMEQAAPEAPRVSDIVAKAGSSNKAFYRYFSSKDELFLAVMERGVAIVVSYLEHQMAKEATPAGKIARWIEGALAQVSDPHLISLSRTAVAQLTTGTNRRVADEQMMLPLRELLAEAVSELGRPDPGRDTDAIFAATTGMLRRYLGSSHGPTGEDVDHLVRFCLAAVGVG